MKCLFQEALEVRKQLVTKLLYAGTVYADQCLVLHNIHSRGISVRVMYYYIA